MQVFGMILKNKINYSIFFKFLVVAFFVSSCASMPNMGPSKSSIKGYSKESKDIGIKFIEINNSNVIKYGGKRKTLINSNFKQTFNKDKDQVLGIGDFLKVSIWEAAGDGLFSTSDKKQTDLDVIVNQKGMIFIPYVGFIKVSEKTISSIQEIITSKLIGRALDPQVQIRLIENNNNTFITIGEVGKPSIYPIPLKGISLLEAISLSGGSKCKAFETQLKVVRSDKIAKIRLDELFDSPENNIALKKGDIVQVEKKSKTVTILGAVNRQKNITFEKDSMSLSDAIALSGGLVDSVSDSSGLYVFRYESSVFLNQIEYSTNFPKDEIPVIYNFDLRRGGSFLASSKFLLQDQDIIYVAASGARGYSKFFEIFVRPLLDISRTGIMINKEAE
jgi:polysaccharide export outer membrane protein